MKDRWERYNKMHPAEVGYVEAAAKAGRLWKEIRPGHGPGRGKVAESPSFLDAGFKGTRDATRCERAGKLHSEDRRTYYEEMLPEFERQAKERQAEEANKRRDKETGRLNLKGSEDTNRREHRASDDAAEHFGVSSIRVRRAKRIKKEAPQKKRQRTSLPGGGRETTRENGKFRG